MTGLFLPRRVLLTDDGPRVEWIETDGSPFAEPFFEQTVRRLERLPANRRNGPRQTPIDALVGCAGVVPDAFIFHVSRCGSTLVCRMLAAHEDSVVVSEAPVLDDILRAARRTPGARDAARGATRDGVTDAERIAWFRGAVGALCAATHQPKRRVFVKLDGWHLFELPLVRRAFPDAAFVFVHRDPLEVLVSLAERPSMALVRGTVAADELGLSTEARDALDPTELAAAIVGAYYRAAATHHAELAPIAYEELPDRVWEAFPGIAFREDEIARMRAAAERDAKQPALPFSRDVERKRGAATPAIRSACARRAEPAYARWLAVARGSS